MSILSINSTKNTKKILVVQFREDITKNHEQQCINRLLGQGLDFTLDYVDIFDSTSAIAFGNPSHFLSNYYAVILGGSGAISMGYGHKNNDYNKANYIITIVAPLLDYILANDFPTLGICFGHQLLGDYLGTKVGFDANQNESGFAKVVLTKEGETDKVFGKLNEVNNKIDQKNLDQDLWSVTMHQDSLVSLPSNVVLLATTDRCKVASFRYKNNIYGTQFHPELNEKDLLYRFSLFPQYQTNSQIALQDSTKITQLLVLFLQAI